MVDFLFFFFLGVSLSWVSSAFSSELEVFSTTYKQIVGYVKSVTFRKAKLNNAS